MHELLAPVSCLAGMQVPDPAKSLAGQYLMPGQHSSLEHVLCAAMAPSACAAVDTLGSLSVVPLARALLRRAAMHVRAELPLTAAVAEALFDNVCS